MISLIIGKKGSGKTKTLVAKVSEALEKSSGSVICIEKEQKLTYDIPSRARLVETDTYGVEGYDALFGFICGVCAGDHDITDILVDATLSIGGRDFAALAKFMEKLSKQEDVAAKGIVFTISADESELPAEIFEYCAKI